MIKYLITVIIASAILAGPAAMAQLSPGDLAEPHAHLEGMSNCTQCHILGEKVSNDKCLACHTALKSRIDQNKGYHVSEDIAGKECTQCHSDHHGRKFELIRFDRQTFDHTLTGYKLEGAHSRQDCEKCHKTEFITDNEIKKKAFTYLGLSPKCVSCHDDYHQNTLSTSCSNCHTFESFKPAPGFNHNKTDYPLLGKHKTVNCEKCHKIETRNGKRFQVFDGVESANCTACHKDVHNNKLGTDCAKCHTEESFHIIKGLNTFNHDITRFKLEGKHATVKCAACHKTKYTDPVKHDRCSDCHKDYHNNQFAREGLSPDCSSCHTNQSFSGSTYTIEQHNQSTFSLRGAHLATPCFACHKKEEKWNFKNIGNNCSDCHKDIHNEYISSKYYPGAKCTICHTEEKWDKIVSFDHDATNFKLTGSHTKPSCRACHFNTENNGPVQQFKGLSTACAGCHDDVHAGQFMIDGKTTCTNCHETLNWKASLFDHNTTRFVLDGKHRNVACNKCHKPIVLNQTKTIQYKFKDFRCETCHQ